MATKKVVKEEKKEVKEEKVEKIVRSGTEEKKSPVQGRAALRAKIQEMRNKLALTNETGLREEIDKLQDEYNAM